MRNLRAITLLATLLASVLATGCATPQPWLAPLPPDSLSQTTQARQQVTAHRNGQSRSLQVAIKATPQRLTLIGLSALGQRLFTLVWDGQQVTLTGDALDRLGGLDPYWILADLQMAYWPLAPLRAALPPDLRLQQIGTARTLWRGDKLLWYRSSATADAWHSKLMLYNERLGYRLTILPLAIGNKKP